MRAFSTIELDRMQTTQEVALPDTCLIQMATIAQDSIGQVTRAWGTRATGVTCRLTIRRASERIAGAKNTTVGDWLLTLAHDQTIASGDRVVIASRTFEVVGLNTGESHETATRVDLSEVV